MTHLQQLKGDIFYIQETYLCNREVQRLKRAWIGQLFHSKFNEKARGTAILIRKNIQFEPHKTVADPTGRFIIVSGKLQAVPVVLANVYGPNWDDSAFITKLFTTILLWEEISIWSKIRYLTDPLTRYSLYPNQLRLLTLSLNSTSYQNHGGANVPQLNFSLFSHTYTVLTLA